MVDGFARKMLLPLTEGRTSKEPGQLGCGPVFLFWDFVVVWLVVSLRQDLTM